MKRSTKQLLSLLLAIVMVCGLMAPAMAARPMGGDVAETPVTDVSGAKLSGVSRPTVKSSDKAELLSAEDGVYTLDFGEAFSAAVAQKDMAAQVNGKQYGTQTSAGAGYFTVSGSAAPKGRIDKSSKTFPDGFAGTTRFNYEAAGTKDGPYVKFTTGAKAVVKVWWVQGGDPGARQMAILDSTGAEAVVTADTATLKNGPIVSYLTLDTAGEYYLVPKGGSNYLFKVQVSEGADVAAPTVAAGDPGTPVVGAPALAEGATDKAEVTVTGITVGEKEETGTVTKYARSMILEYYKDGETEKVGSSDVNAPVYYADATEGAKYTVDLAALGTGTYKFKAVATKNDGTKVESDLSTDSISFKLPLAAPANVSATVTSATSATVTWNTVREATGYEVYQDGTKVDGTPTVADDGKTASLLVEGLTTGTEYSFTVKALRASETSEASDAAKVTPAAGAATAKRTYSLNFGVDLPNDTDNFGAGALAAGNVKKAGTDNFFTINGGPKIVLEGNSATYGDVSYTKRLKTGTKYVAGAKEDSENYYKNNSIKFTVEGPSEVKVHWKAGGTSDNRSLVLLSEDGATEIAETAQHTNDSKTMFDDTLSLAKAGTYYLCAKGNACNLYYIEVVSTLPINTYNFTLDVSADVTAFGKNELAMGNSKKVGTSGYFTITGGSKIQAGTGNKTYEDGYAATMRLRPGTTHKPDAAETADEHWTHNSVMIKTDGAAKVSIWWYGDNTSDTARYIGIWNDKGEEVAAAPTAATAGAAMIAKDLELATAGTYYFVCPANGCTISKIEVTETVVGTKKIPAAADWTATAGSAAITGTAAGEDLNAEVTGIMVGEGEVDGDTYPVYADGIKVDLYQGTDTTGELVDTLESTKAMASTSEKQTLTFGPASSGKYVLQLTVTRSLDNASKVVVSAPVDFILPLATPAINSVASNGKEADKDTASVTVAWSSVAEASSYNLYYRAKAAEGAEAAAWGDPISVPATEDANVNAIVPGLTVGTEYEFTVEAVRAATTIGGVSIPASTTAKSDVDSVTVTANKQIPWTVKVFGTSASADYNSVIEGDYKTDFSVVTNGAKPDPANGKYTDENGVKWDKQPEYAPGTQHTEEFKGLTGDLNTDPEGRILLSSREGSGKITEPTGSDGLLFHYTTVPAGYNFYIRSKVHVTRWFTRDTQNGLGLAVLDRVPAESQSGSTGSNGGDYWNNGYMAGAARLSFRWDADNAKAYASDDPGASSFTNYSYYMGLCSIVKHGRPAGYNAAGAEPKTFQTRRFPLDIALPRDGVSAKYGTNTNRFNTIGNFAALPAGFSTMSENGDIMKNYEMTDFILEIRKTPTGYVSTYWAPDADPDKDAPLGQNIEYYSKGAPELSGGNPYTHYEGAVGAENAVDLSGNSELGLTNMDESAEYVGLFTSRDTDALFTNVEFDMWPQSEDKTPVETPPITTLKPNVTISSGDSSNSAEFTLSVMANVDGWVTITKDGSTYTDSNGVSEFPVKADERLDLPMTLKIGNNRFEVNLKVDEDMELPAYTVLDLSEPPKTAVSNVNYSTRFANLTNIFVSPSANSTGRGTRTSPVDVHTAVAAVRAGQNIILLGGEYKLTKTIRISRGMDGTKQQPIYFVADPANTEPVVLNGQRSAGGIIVHGGNWWVFKGFEVVGSSNGATAFAVSGNDNIVQDVKIHDNGGTGLSITRLNSSVKIPTRPEPNSPASAVTDWGEWPCRNTILNCEAYRNYDLGYGGADGFTAKLTVGEGNVFDGCAAYWNADDGWDLFAKSSDEEGPIGVVTIKNSIAFQNGYEVRKIVNTTTQTPEYEADGYTAVMDLNEDGTVNFKAAGNGNGFKMGGNHLPGAHEIYNSYAFYNHAKGFDSNNGPDITVSGCTSYNNGDENIGLSSNADKSYKVNKVVSFKDDKAPVGAEGTKGLKDGIGGGNGANTGNVIDTATYYAWDGTKSSNGTTELTADNFVSLDFDALVWAEGGAERKADGSLDLGDFLTLKDITGTGAGDLVNDTTPVEDPDAVKNPPEEGSTDTPTSGGNGGTIGGGNDKPDDNQTDDKPATFTANKSTNTAGDTTIVVKEDKTGETMAEVKIPGTIPSSDVKFDDAIDHWAEESIDNMAAMGVVNGIGDNLYGVDSDITRGALATMLFRFANGKEGIANTFADVADGQWYTDAIGWAVKTGVVTGYSDTAFGPNDTITREQLAVMLWRFAKLVGLNGVTSASDLDGFQDAASVGSWATDGMAWCVRNGIIKGVSDDTLSPATSATRAQTAVMLDRFIALLK